MNSRAPHDVVVGRDRLLARLAALFDRAGAGERQTVLVSGEAGIGTTVLLRAAVSEAEARGARVGWGPCIDVDGAPGYWPWVPDVVAAALGIPAVVTTGPRKVTSSAVDPSHRRRG